MLNRELYGLFFTKEGLLKSLADTKIVPSVAGPQHLNLAKNTDLRYLAHALLVLEPTEQNVPHIQQAFRYLKSAEVASGNARTTYRYLAGAIHTALKNPKSNPIILHAPDCANAYETIEQKAVQEKIIQEIRAGLELTDKQRIAEFIQKTIPILQQEHEKNAKNYQHPVYDRILSPNPRKAADIIVKNESSGSGDTQSTQQEPEVPPAPDSSEDPDDDKSNSKKNNSQQYNKNTDMSRVANLDPRLGDPIKIKALMERFINLPGANKLIGAILAAEQGAEKLDGKLGNARGALFELYKGMSEVVINNSQVIRFGQRIAETVKGKFFDFEYDIVLLDKVIECKHWRAFSHNSFMEFMEDAGNRKLLADFIGKTYEVCFSVPIPEYAIKKLVDIGIKYSITEVKL